MLKQTGIGVGGALAGALVLTAVVGSFSATVSAAPKTISLTAIDGYPPKAMWVEQFIKFYIPEVDKRLKAGGNYKIRWNKAFAGAIVKPKGVLKGIQSGLGDIGIVTTVFHPDKVPLQAIAFVTPFTTTDPLLLTRTIDDISNKFPEVKAAWAKYNQVYLTNGVAIDTYQLQLKRPIKQLSDLKGMKIAGAGVNLRYLQNIGAVGVGGSLVTFYHKLKTGVVEGAMVWPEATMAFKIYEVAPFMVDARIGAVNSKAVTVNADVWKKLPAEVKTVLQDVAIAYRDRIARVAEERGKASYAKFTAKGGTIFKLPTAQRDAWARGMPNIAKQWAARLDKQGLPGTKILDYYMDKMRAANQNPARNWDKE